MIRPTNRSKESSKQNRHKKQKEILRYGESNPGRRGYQVVAFEANNVENAEC